MSMPQAAVFDNVIDNIHPATAKNFPNSFQLDIESIG